MQVADKLVQRLKANWHRYSDDTGAYFAILLHEKDLLTPFLERFAKQGYNIELTEVEKQLVRKAGDSANILVAVEDSSFFSNFKKQFTFNVNLGIAMILILGAGSVKTAYKESGVIKGLEAEVETLDKEIEFSISKMLEKGASPEDNEDLRDLYAERVAMRKSITSKTEELSKTSGFELNKDQFIKTLSAPTPKVALNVLSVLMMMFAFLGRRAYNQSVEKEVQLVTEITEFCNVKLGRKPYGIPMKPQASPER